MGAREGDVTVVAPPDATLAAAVSGALTARGWHVHDVRATHAAHDLLHAGAVLLLEDDTGRPAVHVPHGLALHACVVVASARSAHELRDLLRRGAGVLDQDVPLLVLVPAIERRLGPPPHVPPPVVVDAALARRQAEAVGLARLTATERAVLTLLVAGVGPDRIGALRHLSMNTVRSHIRAILGKLGARSQLEAVAVAHRSARDVAGTAPDFTDPDFTNPGEAAARRGGPQ
ncbi:response regulator transcription factor [Cellulomonas iranensis]|uniref:response regulator transcription factor n=1 Tax=Cellulomonas iranensis TaxID=76862 RepID=UPI000B3C248B|nr:LuxR C-terminal-related transcriptional regulator [Cellulomonas iranensis]